MRAPDFWIPGFLIADIATGAKGLVACAGQNHDAYFGIIGGHRHGASELLVGFGRTALRTCGRLMVMFAIPPSAL